MHIPIESGKDDFAVTVNIPVPDERKLREDYKCHFPSGQHETARISDGVFTEYINRVVRRAIATAYQAHLEAFRLTLPNADQFKTVADLRRSSMAGLVRQSGLDVITIGATWSGHYYRLTKLSVVPRAYPDFEGRRRDYGISVSGHPAAIDALRTGDAGAVTVTSKWSKAWAAATKLLADRMAFDEQRVRNQQAHDEREKRRAAFARPVEEALKQVASTPAAYGDRRVYAYGATVAVPERTDGSFTVEVALGETVARLPYSLAQWIIDGLSGTGAQLSLTIGNLTQSEAIDVLAALPQADAETKEAEAAAEPEAETK